MKLCRLCQSWSQEIITDYNIQNIFFDIAEISGLSDLMLCTGGKKGLGIQIIPFSVMVYKLYSMKCGKL